MIEYTGKPLRVLDFDCETRPLSFLGGGFTTDEITAICAAWVKNGKPSGMKVWLLGDVTTEHMLAEFRAMYCQAGLVTGHFIRNFDLPLVNGALMEHGLPALPSKLKSDTKNDLLKRRGISASQENLGAMLAGLLSDEERRFYRYLDGKYSMSAVKWRAANRLTDAGLKQTKKRVSADVKQHVALRRRLLELGYLSRPKVWQSGGQITGKYTP